MNQSLASSVVEVPLDDITVSNRNAREFYNEDDLNDLRDAIGRMGQIYPVVLRRINTTKFELIIGTRRLKVAHRRQAPTIPAFILDNISDQDIVILALAENLHRSDLMPFEEAKAILQLCKDFGMTPREAARRIGKPESFVRGRLKILSLPKQVQDMLCMDEGVSFSHTDILASLKKPRDQIRYARVVAKQKLSKAELITLVHDDIQERANRKGNPALFSPKATALKVVRFSKFLDRKVRPRLLLGGTESQEIRTALRKMHKLLGEMLGYGTPPIGSNK